MEEQLISLSIEKGFKSKITRLDLNTNYFWLCELKRWLRGEHKIFVDIETEKECGNIYHFFDIVKLKGDYICRTAIESLNKHFVDYEKGLETALHEALKLIK